MSVEACAALVERGDPDRFLSAMAAAPDARRVLFPIYAFNLEVARAPWVASEPMIAEMRLQWWRDALEEIGSGGQVRRHEVTTPLAAAIDPRSADALAGLVEARRRDLEPVPFANEAELGSYLDATSGTLMWVAARALGAPGTAEPVVRRLGWAAGLANWFLAVPELEARGRTPLPDSRAGAVQTLARQGLEQIALARRSRHAVPRQAAPTLLSAWMAGPVLARAAAKPGRVAAGELAPSEFRRRITLLWRAGTGRW